MSARSRRLTVVVASLAFVALGAACVDLFHSTDFDTLCTKSPGDPACATGDAMVSDVVGPADADSAPPHLDFCAWSSTEARAQAERACAWLGACERPVGESLFGACVIHAQLAFDCAANPSLRPRDKIDAFWSCLAMVKSCGDVDRCVFPAGVQPCVAVVNGTSMACGTEGNGGVRLECSGPAGRAHGVEPCALTGRTCMVPSDNSVARCAGVLGFACGDGGSCSGTSAVACQPFGVLSLDQGVDCAGYGAGTCSVGDAGSTCTPTKTANTCLEDTRPLCDGNVARTCLAGEDIRIDCAPLGLSCDSTIGGGSTITDPASPCITHGTSACAGDDVCPTPTTLRSCGRGKAYEVDCASVGLGTCAIDSEGRGACAPPP